MSELCAKYSMTPKKRPSSLYDTFLFNDELDMLEVRLLLAYSHCKESLRTTLSSSCRILHSVHDAILPGKIYADPSKWCCQSG